MSTTVMNETRDTFTFSILNRQFPVKCSQSEKEALEKAANYLVQSVQTIKDSGKLVDLERILVMAALNITHEYLSLKADRKNRINAVTQRLQHLREKVDNALSNE